MNAANGKLMGMVQPVQLASSPMYPALDLWLEPDMSWSDVYAEEIRVKDMGQSYRYFSDAPNAVMGESLEHYQARMQRERDRQP